MFLPGDAPPIRRHRGFEPPVIPDAGPHRIKEVAMTRRIRLWITAALTVAATALTVAAATLTVGLTTSASPTIENNEERTRGHVTIDGPAVNLAPTNVHLMGIALNGLD
jgi:hypothetical protein